ncbi:MAG: hypothetical protein K2Y37_14240 [Pirellulales bacterium]|nr:hypothetical protein [Pirellulales bacterium]
MADDIVDLRERVLTELVEIHDYYNDSKVAWRIIHQLGKAGSSTRYTNLVTGTEMSLTDLAGKGRGYAQRVRAATFHQFVAIFENFLLDFLRSWLLAHPHRLGKRMVELDAILNAADKNAVTMLVIDKEIGELLYSRPSAWFKYLGEQVNLGCPTADEIEQFVEMKATRDVLIHNRGVVNLAYVSKTGTRARYGIGQTIDIPERYHREGWELLRKIVADISNAAIDRIASK